ncbi:unnamed protein product [Hermetia illucens]|uniref:Uncharacterized protein n=1 Tax=Hermetia illucens TaxID=343691 RepID=A0A7R8USQ4_HERIL|nr:unnamed protein product [Hermetia illucens]
MLSKPGKRNYLCRDGANAIPGYQKLHTRVIRIRDNRGGQLDPSAMAKPRSGGTALMITVTPMPEGYLHTDECTGFLELFVKGGKV